MPCRTATGTLLAIMCMASVAMIFTGCESMKRAMDPEYAARQEKAEQEGAEKAYWANEVVTGSPEKLDTSGYKKLVVTVAVKGDDVLDSRGSMAIVESAFVNRLLGKGYLIAERSDLDRVLEEMGLQQQSGLTSTGDAVKAGRMLNAEGILVIELLRFHAINQRDIYDGGGVAWKREANVGLSAKLVDIQKGAQVWTASYFKKHSGFVAVDPQKALEISAGKVAEAFPAKAVPATP